MSELLERLQRSLCTVAAAGREHVRVGPFDAFVDHVREPKYFSFALPEPGAPGAVPALPDLRAAFDERGRTARIEFVEVLAPDLERALLADGWTLSDRLPVMVCTPTSFASPPEVDGLTVEMLGGFSPVDRVTGFLQAQRTAFGDDSAITDEELTRWRTHATTSFSAAGVLDGVVVGTARASASVDGVTEVSGVGTLPAFRGRGIAAALTGAVTQAAFAGGAQVAWLTAGDDGAERIYARAGFAVHGTLLAYDAASA